MIEVFEADGEGFSLPIRPKGIIEIMFDPESMGYKLCFVYDQFAYFTSLEDVRCQDGYNWYRPHYECNARIPVSGPTTCQLCKETHIAKIVKIAFDGPFSAPDAFEDSRPLSARSINVGVVPWLRKSIDCLQDGERAVNIYAGTTLEEFIKTFQNNQGEIYLRVQ